MKSKERGAFIRIIENCSFYPGCNDDYDLLDDMIRHYVKYGWKKPAHKPVNGKDILIQLQYRYVVGHYSKPTNRWFDHNMIEIRPERIIAWRYIDEYKEK